MELWTTQTTIQVAFDEELPILDRLVLKSRFGLWWNLPRNVGYRLALLGRDGADFEKPVDQEA